MPLQEELAQLFRRELTRLVEELESFPGDAFLWKTVPGVKNSAGNLTLHLEGNLREYIGRCLGGVAYQRDRDYEFKGTGMLASGLIARVGPLQTMVPEIVAGLTDARLDETFPEEHWGAPRKTGLFLLHLYGHFNYHLGQIDYLRRVLTEGPAVRFTQL
jgi:hypothetical protein